MRRVTSAVLLVIVLTIAAACIQRSAPRPPSSAAPGETPSAPNVAAAQTVIGKLGNFGTYSSIDAAEAVAGFHIPRPPADKYSLAFGQTHLRGGFGRPFSTTNYKYGPGESDAIGLDVAPITDWRSGALQQGTRQSVGGRDGWMTADDSIGWEFAFHCGYTTDGVEVWCLVTAPAKLGLQGLNDFVAALS